MTDAPSLKTKTARTLKWNTIDRFGSQIMFAVVGVVLANVIPKEDFGLVGALAIFQAFASITVDSGFGWALLQKKKPDERDYSTVFWFNLGVSILIYFLLFLCAPLIADLFHGDKRLIPLSKVMFLTFVVNGLAIVQVNRLMKRMDVKMIAVSNLVGLVISGFIGIFMALKGFGAWALVAQQLSLACVKTALLWATGHWRPALCFSRESLREIWRVGISVFSSSMLNTICLNIYNFVIGIIYGMTNLGVYTQAEKWSKMGSASVSAVLTGSFVPLLSGAQDDPERFHRYMIRIDRFTAFILFPFMVGLTVAGAPVFHTLFGNKWDEAIPLFQILMIRGIFLVLFSLCTNYLLAAGKAKALFYAEVVKDTTVAAGLLATIWFNSIPLLVWGQLASSVLAWVIVLVITSRATGMSCRQMLVDLLPFAVAAAVMAAAGLLTLAGMNMVTSVSSAPLSPGAVARLSAVVLAGALSYIAVVKASRMPELDESARWVFGRLRRSK